ncbi:hypothetical protein FACS1894216_16690 [Synergistales bacterium]|nr:hypothetical protein FACS1894216_16690 [Synergistales bacterium]
MSENHKGINIEMTEGMSNITPRRFADGACAENLNLWFEVLFFIFFILRQCVIEVKIYSVFP